MHIYVVYVRPVICAKGVNHAWNGHDINISVGLSNKYRSYLIVPIFCEVGSMSTIICLGSLNYHTKFLASDKDCKVLPILVGYHSSILALCIGERTNTW